MRNDRETIAQPRTCPLCGRPFQPRGRQRWCSDACRLKAFRRRHASTPAEPPPLPSPASRAGLTISVAHALETLKRLQAVEHTWEDQAVVVKATKPEPEVVKILAALGLRIDNPVIQVTKLEQPVA